MKRKDAFKFEALELKAKVQPAKKLILVLHGYKQNAARMMKSAQALHDQIPEADILVLEGFYKLDVPAEERKKYNASEKEIFRTWLKPVRKNTPGSALSAVFNRSKEADFLNQAIDQELKKRGLTNKDLALFGFSMGGGISMHIGQNRPEPCAAVVSHSGAYVGLGKPKSKPDMLLIFGEKDRVIPIKAPKSKGMLSKVFDRFRLSHELTKAILTQNNVPFKEVIVPDLKHKQTKETLDHAGKFIRKKFGL